MVVLLPDLMLSLVLKLERPELTHWSDLRIMFLERPIMKMTSNLKDTKKRFPKMAYGVRLLKMTLILNQKIYLKF